VVVENVVALRALPGKGEGGRELPGELPVSGPGESAMRVVRISRPRAERIARDLMAPLDQAVRKSMYLA
jgi:hypothetical protein